MRLDSRALLCGLLWLYPTSGHASVVPMSGQAGQLKQVAVDVVAAGDQSVATLDIVEDGASRSVTGRAGYQRSNVGLRVGTGRGAELYLVGTPGLGLRWSLLDERRMEVPFSLALALEGGVAIPARSLFRVKSEGGYFGSAIQMSHDVPLNDSVVLRPLVNVWYHHATVTQWAVLTPGSIESTAGNLSKAAGFIDLYQPHVLLPVGVEILAAVSEQRTLNLYGGWTVQKAVGTGRAKVNTCRNCTLVADNLQLQPGSAWFVGVRTEGRYQEVDP